MGKNLRIAVLGVLAVLVCAPPASADTSRVEAAQAIALKRSGPVCTKDNGKVTVSRSNAVTGLALASYRHPSDTPDDRTSFFECKIEFAPGSIPWPKFCSAMVHEYLHLAAWRAKAGDEYVGRGENGLPYTDPHHSRDPRSVMFVRYTHPYFRCGKRPPPAKTIAPLEKQFPKPPPKPLVLLLPGGGWQNADPATMRPWVRDFEAHGVEARAITYPLRDVTAAINHVREVVRAEGRPVVAYGISAGGTIAAFLAAEGTVVAGVNVVGPTDLTRWYGSGAFYLGDIGLTQYDRQRAASPLFHLSRPSPQLQQCGVADVIVTFEQCLRYDSAAKRAQPDTRLDALVNAHGQTPKERATARMWVVAHLPR